MYDLHGHCCQTAKRNFPKSGALRTKTELKPKFIYVLFGILTPLSALADFSSIYPDRPFSLIER